MWHAVATSRCTRVAVGYYLLLRYRLMMWNRWERKEAKKANTQLRNDRRREIIIGAVAPVPTRRLFREILAQPGRRQSLLEIVQLAQAELARKVSFRDRSGNTTDIILNVIQT